MACTEATQLNFGAFSSGMKKSHPNLCDISIKPWAIASLFGHYAWKLNFNGILGCSCCLVGGVFKSPPYFFISSSFCQNLVLFTDGLSGRFHVSKYPTLKLFMFGKLMRREYRGQRSVDALAEYVRSQLNSPIIEMSLPEDIYSMEVSLPVFSNCH